MLIRLMCGFAFATLPTLSHAACGDTPIGADEAAYLSFVAERMSERHGDKVREDPGNLVRGEKADFYAYFFSENADRIVLRIVQDFRAVEVSERSFFSDRLMTAASATLAFLTNTSDSEARSQIEKLVLVARQSGPMRREGHWGYPPHAITKLYAAETRKGTLRISTSAATDSFSEASTRLRFDRCD
jgi:hypothetical protein